MNELTTNKEKVKEVYQNASAETKEALKALFGDESNFKPSLDDYTTIRSYEDACEALGEEPVLNEGLGVFLSGWKLMNLPSHIIALMKLETISRALWGKAWKPKPDAEGSKWFYYPIFGLYTKSEIENMDEDKHGGLWSAAVSTGAHVGFGFLYTYSRSSVAHANFGFRLSQEDSEKAEYFGKQFLELWAEYLKLNFEVGGRLK